MDLKLAVNEALHERVTALEIEIDGMKADINVLQSQTAEQRITAYARKCTEKEAEEETQRMKIRTLLEEWIPLEVG